MPKADGGRCSGVVSCWRCTPLLFCPGQRVPPSHMHVGLQPILHPCHLQGCGLVVDTWHGMARRADKRSHRRTTDSKCCRCRRGCWTFEVHLVTHWLPQNSASELLQQKSLNQLTITELKHLFCFDTHRKQACRRVVPTVCSAQLQHQEGQSGPRQSPPVVLSLVPPSQIYRMWRCCVRSKQMPLTLKTWS